MEGKGESASRVLRHILLQEMITLATLVASSLWVLKGKTSGKP